MRVRGQSVERVSPGSNKSVGSVSPTSRLNVSELRDAMEVDFEHEEAEMYEL